MRHKARRKRLKDWLQYCNDWISGSNLYRRFYPYSGLYNQQGKAKYSLHRKPIDRIKASKGFSATEKQYYMGNKMDFITSSSGVFQQINI